jgi:hypothetical protein
MFLLLVVLALQSAQPVALKRVEVLRVNPADMDRIPPALRPLFVDPTPDAEPVDNLETATSRAGFSPRLPMSSKKPQFGVMDPTRAEVKIDVADVNAALQNAKAANVTVPKEWDGVTITVQQGRGILADFGDFLITQAPPLTFSAPSGFPLDQFMEVLFRILGSNAADARTLRQKFAANPAAFILIPLRYEMDIHEVRLNSGSGLLLQNGDKIGELALAWTTADRTYFVTGLVTEAQVVQLANSIQ